MRPSQRILKPARLGLPLLGLFLSGLVGCDVLGPDDQGGPGVFTLTLLSPYGEEGSAVFELTGGEGLGTVSPVGGEVFYRHGNGITKVVVVLDDPGEVRFRVRTEDVREDPTVRVVQVADGEDQLRPATSGYSVQLEKERDASRGGRGGGA